MRTTTVFDVMTSGMITVAPATPVKDIIDLLDRNRISAVPVIDPRGALLGVVSESDLLRRQEHQDDKAGATVSILARRRARERWRKSTGLTAAEIMTSPALTVSAEASLPSAARLLTQADVRRLFICRDGIVAGVVTRRDLLHCFLRPDADIKADIDQDIFRGALHANMTMVLVTVTHGLVMLTGQLEYEADVATAARLCHTILGVVDVTNRLGYIWNGSGSHLDASVDVST